MPCYAIFDNNGKQVARLTGDLGPSCGACGGIADFLCDYPVGEGLTCDRPVCERHAGEVAPDIHYCPGHLEQWRAFEESGGVKRVLESVIPFKKSNQP